MRATYNGDDFHLFDPNYGGNGNAHPEVIPEWALSLDDIQSIESVITQTGYTSYMQGSPAGYNWENALRVGWNYEPGSL
jgi:hypothetical protein